MKIAVLCDGDRYIGAGHYFRCAAVCKEFFNEGDEARLFLKNADLIPFAQKVDIPFELLTELFEDNDGLFDAVIARMKAYGTDKILVDSHRATNMYLSRMHNNYRITYFDDLLKYPYPVDLLINTHIDITEESYHSLYKDSDVQTPQILVGADYFPFRCNGKLQDRSHVRKRVGFFAGGSDPGHVTVRLLEFIRGNKIILDYDLCVVVGLMNQDYKEIKSICDLYSNIEFIYGLTDLSDVYSQLDIAVSAAGITLYEIASCGIPSIAYAMVDNQVHTGEAFAHLGISLYIGNSNKMRFFQELLKSVGSLLRDDDCMNRMSAVAYKTFDGQGANRIARAICSNKDC